MLPLIHLHKLLKRLVALIVQITRATWNLQPHLPGFLSLMF